MPTIGTPDHPKTLSFVLRLSLSGLSLFFIFQQLYLLYRLSTSYHEGYKIYFSGMWNYVDLVPAILMQIFLGNKILGLTEGFT